MKLPPFLIILLEMLLYTYINYGSLSLFENSLGIAGGFLFNISIKEYYDHRVVN